MWGTIHITVGVAPPITARVGGDRGWMESSRRGVERAERKTRDVNATSGGKHSRAESGVGAKESDLGTPLSMIGRENARHSEHEASQKNMAKFPSDLSMRRSHSQTVRTAGFHEIFQRAVYVRVVLCLFSTRYLVYIYGYVIKNSGSNTRATRPLGYSIQLDPM